MLSLALETQQLHCDNRRPLTGDLQTARRLLNSLRCVFIMLVQLTRCATRGDRQADAQRLYHLADLPLTVPRHTLFSAHARLESSNFT